jgi:protein-tyrosine kinase
LEVADMSEPTEIQMPTGEATVEKGEREADMATDIPALPAESETEGSRLVAIGRSETYPLVLDHTHRIAAESFSILRSRLLAAHVKHGIHSILLTSPGMEEGKTLISVNLGLSFGHLAQKRVLLVDADLRANGATSLLKMTGRAGLGDFLQGKKTAEGVIYPTTFPHLSVLPAGQVPEKSLPELLAGPEWRELVEFAKQRYDLMLIDSVPVAAPVVDLELLAAPCNATLLIVQIRKTTRESLSLVPKRLDVQKILGIVVNNADELSEHDYSYYQYYGSRSKRGFRRLAATGIG